MTVSATPRSLVLCLALGLFGAGGCTPDNDRSDSGDTSAPATEPASEPGGAAAPGPRISADPQAPDSTMDNAAPESFTAIGQEPGWTLTLTPDGTRLVSDYGQSRVSFETPPPVTLGGETRYDLSEDVTLIINDKPCQDVMSGAPYPKTVTIKRPQGDLMGCGGDPAAQLTGPEWVVEDIGQGGVIDSSRATLNFGGDGRLAGRATCNSYSADYTLAGPELIIGPAMATKMACPEALMNQESRFFEALSGVDNFVIGEHGALILRTGSTPVITARR